MQRKGFTLIELLVVIAIIAILAAILFPVFAKAREKARQTKCTNNQRQVALAVSIYAQDHDEMMPKYTSMWQDVKLDKETLVCPSAPRLVNGYGYNFYIAGVGVGKVQDPVTAVLCADDIKKSVVPNILLTGSDLDIRHQGKVIVAYVDGHVELASTLPALVAPGIGIDLMTNVPADQAPPGTNVSASDGTPFDNASNGPEWVRTPATYAVNATQCLKAGDYDPVSYCNYAFLGTDSFIKLYHYNSNNSPNYTSLTRNLLDVTGTQMRWTISGQLQVLNNFAGWTNPMAAIRVLDNAGVVIASIDMNDDTSTTYGDISFNGNGTGMGSISRDKYDPRFTTTFSAKWQPFAITMLETGDIVISVGGMGLKASALSGSNAKYPAKLEFRNYCGGNHYSFGYKKLALMVPSTN